MRRKRKKHKTYRSLLFNLKLLFSKFPYSYKTFKFSCSKSSLVSITLILNCFEFQAQLPFAVVGSNTLLDINGKKLRGRMYPWGIAEGIHFCIYFYIKFCIHFCICLYTFLYMLIQFIVRKLLVIYVMLTCKIY